MRRCEVCGTITPARLCPRDGELTVSHQLGPARELTDKSEFSATEVFLGGLAPVQEEAGLPAKSPPQAPAPQNTQVFSGKQEPQPLPSGAQLAPSDLPQSWEAPAPVSGRVVKRETLHMLRDNEDEGEEQAASSHDSSLELPVELGPTDATAAQLNRQSGGWGDALFGDVGLEPPAAAPERLSETPPQHDEKKLNFEVQTTEAPASSGDNGMGRLLLGAALALATVAAWNWLASDRDASSEAAPTAASINRASSDESKTAQVAPEPDNRESPKASSPPASTLDEEADDEKPLVSYRARLSKGDHQLEDGTPITIAWQVLLRDRQRVHQGAKDPQDWQDERFHSKESLTQLESLLKRRRLPSSTQQTILGGEPLVEVKVWQDQVTVSILPE